MSDERDPEREESRTPDEAPRPDAADETDDQPLTGEPVAPMRLRPVVLLRTRLLLRSRSDVGRCAGLCDRSLSGAVISTCDKEEKA